MARIFMVATEPSGDVLAAEVVDELRALDGGIALAAIGGEALSARGLVSPIDIAPLSILGLFEGVKVYPKVIALADQAVDEIIRWQPDAVVLVDSWGFMVRVAQRLRKRAPDIRVIKLVGPQIWATRAGRAKTLAKTVDALICIHPMEAPYYEPLGLPVTVMGNPALTRAQQGDGAAYRRAAGLTPDDDMLLVLPGSRMGELKRVAPALVEAARQIKAGRPKVRIVFAPAPSIRAGFVDAFPDLAAIGTVADARADQADMMAAATVALACSGTVTSELAVQGVPFVVAYKTGWLTWLLARYILFKPNHITLLNIAADDTEIVPEFVQTKMTPERLSAAALHLLQDVTARAAQVHAQNKALSRMRGEGHERAQRIAAMAILNAV